MSNASERAATEIIRDEWGIPHIFASSKDDAWFAQGYVHAQDRLWQMIYDRFRAQGRQAELIGQVAVTADTFIRRIGVFAAAEADAALLKPEELAVFHRYADGVNAFIATGTRPIELELLEMEPEPWRPVDSIAIWKMRHIFMGSKGPKIWRSRLLKALGPNAMTRLATSDGREELLVAQPGESEVWRADADEFMAAAEAWAEGSNSWGLDGSRTASGSPIIAGDPHRILESPNVYVQMQLACDAFDVVGLAIPGIPGFPHFGHNGDVAWCITHAMADDQDLYSEHFDAGGRVRDPDGWSEPERRSERIQVFGAAPVEVEIVRTRRGPVILGDPRAGTAISIRWVGSDEPRRGLACLGAMLEVTSSKEMDEAMREWVLPCNSMLIADRTGDLRYLHRGRLPLRPATNGWLPVPAWKEEFQWRGDVPFEELPRVTSPTAGWIVTANNRIVTSEFPHYIALDYAAPNRARRIIELIENLQEPADIESMRMIHGDVVSLAGRALLNACRESITPVEPLEIEAFEVMCSFEAEMTRDSAPATILSETRDAFLQILTSEAPLSQLHFNPFPEEPMSITPEMRLRSALQRLLTQKVGGNLDETILGGRPREALLGVAFKHAVASLRERFGDDVSTWTYDRIHRTEIRHPLSRRFPDANLDPPSVAVDGDGDTVCVSSTDIGTGVYHASVARYAFDLADRDASAWIVPLGASGNPTANHHHDQQDLWARCQLIPIVSDRARLAETAAQIEVLDVSR